ncbi:unnamed protein product [Effrenium voratum]|nr:unnamed protein product [Effrenium voratum]
MGQLGLGACRRCPSPSKVTFPKQCEGSIRGIAAGFASSFAVTAHGWVYSWGCNEKCELGLGAAVRGTATPKPLDSLYQVKVVQVAAGFSHTACVTDSGLLYLWGYGAYGQLGFGFDDLRSSMRLGRGWSATKPGQGGRAGEGGFALTGQWQPWQQAWPRRCRRGPFRTRRCKSVQCGAYHTMAEASEELLGPGALRESEVLCPLPLELSDLPADAKEVDHRLPPGAGGGVPALRAAKCSSQDRGDLSFFGRPVLGYHSAQAAAVGCAEASAAAQLCQGRRMAPCLESARQA